MSSFLADSSRADAEPEESRSESGAQSVSLRSADVAVPFPAIVLRVHPVLVPQVRPRVPASHGDQRDPQEHLFCLLVLQPDHVRVDQQRVSQGFHSLMQTESENEHRCPIVTDFSLNTAFHVIF